MSRNSSGTYTLPVGNPVISGTVIEASWANGTLSDLADAMTDSLSRSGQGGMTASLRIIDGSTSVPAFAFANETGSGAYRAAAGDWYLTVLGNNIARLRSTGMNITGDLGVSGNATITGTLSSGAFTPASVSVTGNATVGGTLGVTGNATVGGTLGVTGVATLTANPVLNGGTANGVAYLNGSKVLTTGSELTFNGTTLTNTRNTTDGTAAALTLSNSGASNSYATLNLNAGSVAYQNFSDAAGDAIGTPGVMFRTTSNHPIVWGINNSEKMRLTSQGLGVLTSSVVQALTIGGSGNMYATAGATWYTGGDLFIRAGSGGSLRLGANDTNDLMRLNTAGNLGLGVTPSAWSGSHKAIQVNSRAALASNGGNASLGYNWYNNGSANVYVASAAASLYEQTSGNHAWYTAPSGTAGNAISFTQAMTLDANRNFSVGTTSTASGSQTDSITAGKVIACKGPLDTHSTSVGIFEYNSDKVAIRAYGATPGSGYISFNVGGGGNSSDSEAVRIASNASVSIGSTSSTGKFTVDYTAPSTFTNSGSDFVTMWRASGTNALGVATNTSDATARLVLNNGYQFAINYATSEAVRVDSSLNLKFNSGYGSVATAYGCRAWVNFNGTGTVAIRSSGNVSSITDNGIGNYRINFSTSMPDTNYCPVFGGNNYTNDSSNYIQQAIFNTSYFATSSLTMLTKYAVGGGSMETADHSVICVSVFR